MFLGIEIGGTKLQLGISHGREARLVALQRLEVVPADGAEGIRRQIADSGLALLKQFPVSRIGIGFGGPVLASAGRTITSHQIPGWKDFPLADWCHRTLGLPTVIGNDCDVAALAESAYGAGQGHRVVFYITVGTGVGGGCVVDGRLIGDSQPAIAEIGHLRPGLTAVTPDDTVESRVSGWGIARAARQMLATYTAPLSPDEVAGAEDLLARCDHDPAQLTALAIGQAAQAGNPLAGRVLNSAVETLGWAIAQMITLLAPHVVVVGGGVPQLGDALFFTPLRHSVRRYVFTPLLDTYEIVPAALGEQVVVHGAVALAAIPSS
ncbi:MAG: ROK family protein [Pirellulaceae bacterium]